MKVKRIYAEDMRQAIRKVREEQGPDAVILSTKQTAGGVEVLAALDANAEELRSQHVTRTVSAGPRMPKGDGPGKMMTPDVEKGLERLSAKLKGTPLGSPAGAPGSSQSPVSIVGSSVRSSASKKAATNFRMPSEMQRPSPTIESIVDELAGLRSLMARELGALNRSEYARQAPDRAALIDRLEGMALDRALARRFVEALPEAVQGKAALDAVLGQLADRIPVAEQDVLRRGGSLALMGPTGVGKTSTALKLAAAFSARHGRSTVALIGADRDRLGTERELLDRAASLGIYTLAVSGKESLRSALADVSDRRLVIVDTAGLGHRDPRLSEQAQFISDFPELTAYLVLAAPAQRSTLEATIRRYGALNPRGCVLTKLDETASLGEALTALTHCGLPLAFCTDGQGANTEALHLPRPKSLVARMAALAEEGSETASPIGVEASFDLEQQPLAPKPFTPQELNYA
jgi:flagellar biosynthesis protein FlhF